MLTAYQLITTADDMRRAVEDLATRNAIGLDTETTDLDPYLARLRLIQLATSDSVYIVDLNHFAHSDLKESEALAPLRKLLTSPRPIKIAHNAKFDAKFIKHNLGVDIVGLFDTLLASQLVSAAVSIFNIARGNQLTRCWLVNWFPRAILKIDTAWKQSPDAI